MKKIHGMDRAYYNHYGDLLGASYAHTVRCRGPLMDSSPVNSVIPKVIPILSSMLIGTFVKRLDHVIGTVAVTEGRGVVDREWLRRIPIGGFPSHLDLNAGSNQREAIGRRWIVGWTPAVYSLTVGPLSKKYLQTPLPVIRSHREGSR